VQELRLRTERQSQLVDITRAVQGAVAKMGEVRAAAAVLVYVPHTTAGVTVNEHADPAVARDFEAALERLVPAEWPWQHVEEGEENAPTHIRASFMGPSVVIPLRDGALALGTWQGIFFCEFDGPRERSVYVSLLH
jgi:secondary thiamine-phosphate synthase enzyme